MINKEQIEDMLHALGNPSIRKNWRPSTILKHCYRNRYVDYKENKSWEDLINKKLADKVIQNQQGTIEKQLYFYFVTEEGIKYLQNSASC